MPPATAASKSRSTPALLGGLEQLGPVRGEQLLVAGDDRLAGLEGGEDELAGRLDAPDELDDEVDLGVVDDRGRVGGEELRRERDRARLVQVAHGDPSDLEAQARAGLDGGGLGPDQLDQGGADVPAAQHAHAHRHRACSGSSLIGAIVGVASAPTRFGSSPHSGRSWRRRSSRVSRRDDLPRRAVGHEHHRRAQHLVVVGAHRVPVGTGDRRGEDVPDGEVGRDLRIAHQHVARLAVLARRSSPRVGRSAVAARGRKAS